jgi:thymidylate synthase (FAD)
MGFRGKSKLSPLRRLMEGDSETLKRLRVEALDAILGQPIKVLDDGFIRVVDYMGSDASIVQAARVSYGAGTKKVHEDRGLIRYLMRHRHTTPFEMCELKLHVRVPMDCWRQWIRHRMACLAGSTEIHFDLPGGIRQRGNQLYKLTIEGIWRRFQPTANRFRPDKQKNPYFRRDRVRRMRLRQIDEDTLLVQRTRVVDVFKNGPKDVFRMVLDDGKRIECTADHRFLFPEGWKSLGEAAGLRVVNGKAVWDAADHEIYVNGHELEVAAPYRDKVWLNEQYNVLHRRIEDIALLAGVSYHTIRKWLASHRIQHEKGGRSQLPWNKGRRYLLGMRELTEAWKQANRRSRAGQASNFWRGGMSAERASIGRWTTQVAPRVHARNGWTCQLCEQRGADLACHHIVPVWADVARARDESNLTTLCVTCHRRVTGQELAYIDRLNGPPVRADWKRRPRRAWNKLTTARRARIVAFEYLGERETYDLEVEGPFHNFIANGIVTHNSINEYSTRYSVAIDAAQKTGSGEWRLQAAGNRQGSAGFLEEAKGSVLSAGEEDLHRTSRAIYEERLKAGIAREQARKDLPLSTYTEAYWKIDLHNLLHFLALRMDDHAQEEIRAYATAIGHEVVSKWCPIAWEAFLDYRRNSLDLSRLEVEVIRALGGGETAKALEIARSFGWLEEGPKGLKRNREREELARKLAFLNLPVPWQEDGGRGGEA